MDRIWKVRVWRFPTVRSKEKLFTRLYRHGKNKLCSRCRSAKKIICCEEEGSADCLSMLRLWETWTRHIDKYQDEMQRRREERERDREGAERTYNVQCDCGMVIIKTQKWNERLPMAYVLGWICRTGATWHAKRKDCKSSIIKGGKEYKKYKSYWKCLEENVPCKLHWCMQIFNLMNVSR